ncbi:Lj965 prophage protein [Paenibacillus alvei TS-15]|uniref:Lj965 prophage protein n=1 Tax=Paenibacillus alvei TS-15 TaxID=1117108 RepID=S9U814_PAEAL|nr:MULTISPECIES: DUF6711 family protein [Paenibacillus]EPY06625.1 Lj965 prophage protein [Paenibacillus alvei TS-15]GAV13231.1 prophage protein [Paenibacillus sp. NAIST15-1]
MQLKINGQDIAAYPSQFTVTTLDLDDGESSVRTADGTLKRDRIAVKRQIEMTWGQLPWATVSALLRSMENVFFPVTYPDPMTGKYETKTFYVGNRPTPFAVSKGSEIMWNGLKLTLTER